MVRNRLRLHPLQHTELQPGRLKLGEGDYNILR